MTDKHAHRFLDRSAIESEASNWLARLDSDEPVSTAEFDQLCEWVRRSPAHREALDRLSAVWEQMDALDALAVPLGRSGIEPLAWLAKAFDAVLNPRYAAVAASLAIVIALVALVVGSDSDPQGTLANGKYATRIGEIRDLDLADGSIIHLNTDSVVLVDFDNEERTIFLERGEAHFQVAPEFGRRFVVFTDIGAIEAIGTAFQVRVFPGEVEVTVTEGVVDLRSLPGQLTGITPVPALPRSDGAQATAAASLGQLVAGQSTRIDGSLAELGEVQTLRESEVALQLSWREGQLMFAGEALAEVVEEVSRYTEIDVVFTDPDIKSIPIGGRFKIGETDALFDVLQASFGVGVKRVGATRVELHRKPI